MYNITFELLQSIPPHHAIPGSTSNKIAFPKPSFLGLYHIVVVKAIMTHRTPLREL